MEAEVDKLELMVSVKEIYWVVYFSRMAFKVECNFESPETLSGRSWTRFEFPPLVSKGVSAAWSLLTAAGEGVTSGKLVREMAGDAEVAWPLEFLVPCLYLFLPSRSCGSCR